MKNKIFQSRDLCLRALDTNSTCAKSVRRNEEKMEVLLAKSAGFCFGVKRAVENINAILADKLEGKNALNQVEIDTLMIREDGTANKAKLGANAFLGTSLAVAKAAAKQLGDPLYQYLG